LTPRSQTPRCPQRSWLSNPIWLGGALTITAYSVFTQFFYDPAAHLGSTGILTVQVLFGVIFIWIATWSAILSFGIGKWIPTVGAWVRVLLLSAFTLTVGADRAEAVA
jgi:glutamate:GABA antiporter